MTEPRDTIRSWALLAVAVTSVAIIAFAGWLIYLLAIPDWCGRAVGAAKDVARSDLAVGGCFSLLQRQVLALSINSYIALGTLALCLAVLTVIVLAGGRLSFKASKEGVQADVSHDPGEAAQIVADAAQVQADQVKGTA